MPPRKEPDMETYSGRLAARIRKLRESTGRTTTEAAERMTKLGYEVSDTSFRHWENGTRTPKWDAMPFLAKALKVKVREVIPVK
mgnify:CR=1 FL=1